MAAAYDICIIGGGIVGLATAKALSEQYDIHLAVLEAEPQLASHQTGHNSGVIHSGLYYRPGSLKAQTCTTGREALYQFCRKHDIPHEKCGKVVVAATEEELPQLNELERRGRANGLEGIHRLDADGILEHEPHVRGVEGLFVEETGIVDFVEVSYKLADLTQQHKGTILTDSCVHECSTSGPSITLRTESGIIDTKHVINCAGLQSDRVAKLCGVKPDIRIIPFRGEYYQLKPESTSLVKGLIYPVPDPSFPFLGVHFTRTIDGEVEAGPNAVLSFKREGYSKYSFSLHDTFDFLTYGGFWKLISQYWRTGFGEMYRSISKRVFVSALQKLIPEIEPGDVESGKSGVRAQALGPEGNLIDDFHIMEAENMIHVLNAPSPAATASLRIGERIADMAEQRFGL